MKLTADTKTLFIAFGGGLYWSSSVLLLTAWKPLSSPVSALPFATDFLYIALAVIVCALLACSKAFAHRRGQTLLALGGIVATIAFVSLGVLPVPQTPAFGILAVVANAFHHACFILFWSLNFAVLDKRDAERTIFLTALVAFALYALCSTVSAGAYGIVAIGFMKIVATVPFLCRRYDLPVVDRPLHTQNLPLLVPFFLSRVFYGLALAFLFFLVSSAKPAPSPFAIPLAALALIVLAATALRSLRSGSSGNRLLRIMPLFIAGFLVLPYLGNGQEGSAFDGTAAAIVWLSWITLSSVQVSDLEERVGLDAVKLPFAEKAVVNISVAFGYLVARSAFSSLDAPARLVVESYAPPIIVYLAIIVSCYLFSNLIDAKERQTIVDKALKLSESQMEQIYRDIARDHRLTERESEVLALMAQGHTRPYMCEKLYLSEGTVRSHANHVYQKLDIHSREELYELVETRKKRFSVDKPIL